MLYILLLFIYFFFICRKYKGKYINDDNDDDDDEEVSLHSKRSRARTMRTKFGPYEGVFLYRAARKMGQEQKVGSKGVGRGKKGTLARKPLDFERRQLVFTVELKSQ